jgi:hypothetical protein
MGIRGLFWVFPPDSGKRWLPKIANKTKGNAGAAGKD